MLALALKSLSSPIPNEPYENVEREEDSAERCPCAYSYFSNYRDLLVRRSTHRRYQKHLPFYVVHCAGDYTFRKRKLAWMEQQGSSAFRCAAVSDDSDSIVP